MGIFDSFYNNRKKRKNLRKLAELERSVAEKKANLDRLRNDPEYKQMKKKYNLKDVPGIDTPAKDLDLDDFLKNTQKQIKKSRASAAKSKKTKK
tara:strand:- start:334 stop:615 length:282 start_codon:yes stop_codon:yes gene_type:complete